MQFPSAYVELDDVDYEMEFKTVEEEVEDKTVEEEANAGPSSGPSSLHIKRSFQDTLNFASPGSPRSDSEEEQPQQMFRFPATVFIRNFKGHKKGPSGGKVNVNCGSAEEVMQVLWDFCVRFISGESVAGEDADKFTVRWHENLHPESGDMDRFITIQDKASKRTYKPSQLLEKLDKMQKFLNGDINVFVHIYSESVTSSSMYETLRMQLIKPEERDRAGAASNQANSSLSSELKELYKQSYISSVINWSVWSSSSSKKVLNTTLQDVCIAQNVNTGYKQLLDGLQADLDKLLTFGKSMQRRLTALQAMQATNTSLLADVSGSISASEDSFGQNLTAWMLTISNDFLIQIPNNFIRI